MISAFELIKRRNILREQDWDTRLNKFRSDEKKDILYKEHDKLLTNWEKVLQDLYFNLLQKQDRQIQKILKQYQPTQNGVTSIVENAIDENTKSWSSQVYDFYISLVNDYAFYQVDLLLPTEKEMPHSIPYYTKRTDREIIEQGFFYRLVSIDDFPLANVRSNREVAEYITAQVENLLPALSNTTKKKDLIIH